MLDSIEVDLFSDSFISGVCALTILGGYWEIGGHRDRTVEALQANRIYIFVTMRF
jgi:hypothetical protein